MKNTTKSNENKVKKQKSETKPKTKTVKKVNKKDNQSNLNNHLLNVSTSDSNKNDELKSNQSETNNQNQKSPGKPDIYVVTRAGMRVSDIEYTSPDDPNAIDEANFWKRVALRAKDGTEVNIVKYDKKKHRVY